MKLGFVLVLAAFVLIVSGVARASNEDQAKQVAVALVYANVNGQYGRAWTYLHPRYQRVTTRAFWENCKRKLAEKDGITLFDIHAIDAYPDRVTLPLLGTIRVIAVTLVGSYVRDGQQGLGSAADTHLWVRVGSEWKALWTAEQYRAYKAHRCPA